jgi:hypothetical protein
MNAIRMMMIALAFISVAAGTAAAQHQHGGHAGHGAPGVQIDQKEVVVDGFKVTFQVMSNAEHKKMLVAMKSKEEPEPGTTHNIAVVVQDQAGRKEVLDAEMRMKVLGPKDDEQIKPMRLSKEMKSYDNYFNLSDKGQYELLVAFRTAGKTVKAGAYHTEK